MAHQVQRIYISVMKESDKGLSYWVKIEREDGGRYGSYMSYYMDRSIYHAAELAHFFGIEVTPLESIPHIGLTEEMINEGHEQAKLMVKGLEVKDWKWG